MTALQFPDEALLRSITASGRLNEVLQMFARALIAEPSASWAAEFCKNWLRSDAPALTSNKDLRTAVYHLLFENRILVNASVETYWDIIARFGPTNQTVSIAYLETAPKSVPLKIGRLMLAKAEFGVKPMTLDTLQQVVAVFLAAPSISKVVTTREWLRALAALRTSEADVIAKMAKAYAPDGPVYALTMLFPQISANKAHMLLARTGDSVEVLSSKMLDEPDFADKTLRAAKKTASKPKKYVVLDSEEKQRRAETQKQKRRLETSYKYAAFFDDEEDPDPEAQDTVQETLSEADKKLLAQEQLLWGYWQSHREVFDRASRKSELRKTLKAKLKWTDEQIEGWGRVSAKDSHNQRDGLNLPKNVQEVAAYAPAMSSIPDPISTGSQDSASKDLKPHEARPEKPQTQKPGRKLGHKPGQNQGQESGQKPGQKPAQKAGQKTGQNQGQKTGPKPSQKPGSKPTQKKRTGGRADRGKPHEPPEN